MREHRECNRSSQPELARFPSGTGHTSIMSRSVTSHYSLHESKESLLSVSSSSSTSTQSNLLLSAPNQPVGNLLKPDGCDLSTTKHDDRA